MRDIVLAGGCFWGIEEFISRVKGIKNTTVGFANGNVKNPSYEEVCTGETGHAEACYVTYDENEISLNELLNKFWSVIDPTTINRQANDIGHQYRTGIYYINEEDESIIVESINKVQKQYEKPVVTEVMKLKCFYKAEEYHQKYLKKNPNGYCHINFNKVKP